MEQKWLENAKVGNLNDMKEIFQRLRNIGLLQEVKNFKDSDDATALFTHGDTTENEHLDICQFLVRGDLVDVNSRNVIGCNALHWAAINNQPEIAKLLLEETSIDVNEQDNDGVTALHWAVLGNSPEVTRILLKYKPILLRDNANDTALDIARKGENEEIFQILKTHFNM